MVTNRTKNLICSAIYGSNTSLLAVCYDVSHSNCPVAWFVSHAISGDSRAVHGALRLFWALTTKSLTRGRSYQSNDVNEENETTCSLDTIYHNYNYDTWHIWLTCICNTRSTKYYLSNLVSNVNVFSKLSFIWLFRNYIFLQY